MDPYAVLGVPPTARREQVRAAYLAAARRSHPDLHAGSDLERRRAEARMTAINQAWDAIVLAEAEAVDAASSASTTESADSERWTPFDSDEVASFDERDDEPITAGGLPEWLRLAPPLSFAGGLVAMLLGALTGLLPIVAVGMIAVASAGVLFLVAPFVALTSSRRDHP